MKVLIFPTRAQAIEKVATRLLDAVRLRPTCTLGLATGGTMEPLYSRLCDEGAETDFSKTRTFNLDEYVGLAPNHSQSYHRYMAHHLFDHLNFDAENIHIPRGDAPRAEDEAARYETAIARAGGIDLQLLGLGSNGHIGFNEPGSSLGSRTRIKTLTRTTREDNARFFGAGETVPRYAITMGIKTILDAQEIIILATGEAKAEACRLMTEGPLSASCPASALQLHPHVTAVLDEAAAEKLELREYLETVHPRGDEAFHG